MIVAIELPKEVDLSLFSRMLVQTRIPHRISESGANQLIWVPDDSAVASVKMLWTEFQSSEMSSYTPLNAGSLAGDLKSSSLQVFAQLMSSPLTLTLIVACLICYPITWGIEQEDLGNWLRLFNFTDFNVYQDRIYFANFEYTLTSGEYWRLVSPMFLHFGILHLVFNLGWLLDFGRRIEWVNGPLWLFALVISTSLGANLLQYWVTGPGLVGGMSGVIYGLLGFSLVWQRWMPNRSHQMPKSIYIVMLVFLALGFSGVVDSLFQLSVANWAHLGGLISGLGMGGIAVLSHRVATPKS